MNTAITKRRCGAPTKYSAEIAKQICDAVADGVPITHVARLCGLAFESLCSYRRKYPDFDHAVQTALSRGIQERLGVIKRAMASQDENVALRAACWWLTHTPGAAEHFSQTSRLEVTGGDGQPLAVGIFLPRKNGEPEPVTINSTRIEDAA